MNVVVKRVHRSPGPRSSERPFLRRAIRLAVSSPAFAVVVVALCAMAVSAEETEISSGMSVSIPSESRVQVIGSFELEARASGDEAPALETAPKVHVAEVSVATNMSDWSVVVRFTLPESGTPDPDSAPPRCRLQDSDGRMLSEEVVENGDVLLEGNGRRGHQTLFLEVDGLLDAFGVEVLAEPVVEVEGRLAKGNDTASR